MKAILAAILCLIFCGSITAQDTVSTVTFAANQSTLTIAVFESKTYLIRVDPGQPPSFDPVTITYLQLGGDVPPPPPPPPPPATPLAKHRVTVKDSLAKVTDANKAATMTALSKLYVTIADLPVTERGQLAQATDIMFNALNLPPAWHTWKAATDKSLDQFTDLAAAKAAWKATGEVLGGAQ